MLQKWRRLQRMPKGGVIADTNVWIEFFNTRSKVSNALRDLLRDDRIVILGIIEAELIQGTKTPRHAETIASLFSVLPYLEADRPAWVECGRVSAQLRKKGITLPLSDILIAVMASVHGCQIFTLDRHFEKIPGVDFYST